MCSNLQSAIRIDEKSEFDLRSASWRRRDILGHKSINHVVIVCHLPFAIKDLDYYLREAVLICSKSSLIFDRDCCISPKEIPLKSSCFFYTN